MIGGENNSRGEEIIGGGKIIGENNRRGDERRGEASRGEARRMSITQGLCRTKCLPVTHCFCRHVRVNC